MEKRFNKVDKKFEKVDRDIADVRGSIAELSATVKDYREEMLVSNYRMDQHAGAITQLATATNVKLNFEL